MSQNGKTLWQITKVHGYSWSTCILKGMFYIYLLRINGHGQAQLHFYETILIPHKCKLLLRLAIKPKVAIAMPRPPTIFCFVWPHKMWIFAKWMIQLLINQCRFRSLGSINGTAENLKLYNHWLAFTVT